MIQWVVICYVLSYSSLLLALGRAGDMFGHARVFRLGLLWSTGALLLCSLAGILANSCVQKARTTGSVTRPMTSER